MRFRTLGNTDLHVSEVGLGLWTLATTWWGEHSREQALAMIRQAFDLGVTFYDAADTYGDGLSEELLADAFAERRQSVQIATKFGYDWYAKTERSGHEERPHNWSPDFVRYALEQSLRRLRTDYIDLYQLHNPRMSAIQRDDLWALLEDFQREGKIRAFGVALGPAIGWLEEGLVAMEDHHAQAVQQIYNMVEQAPCRDMFPLARQTGASVIVRVPHSSGLLEGHFTADTTFPAGDHRNHRPRSWLTEGVKKVETLRFLSEETGMTLGQAAIKFCLAEPSVTSVLPNIYTSEQLVEFAAAPDQPDLTQAQLDRIVSLYEHNFHLADAASATA